MEQFPVRELSISLTVGLGILRMSLFMSEEESNERLNDPRNVLSRVNRETSAPVTEDQSPGLVIPDISSESTGDAPDVEQASDPSNLTEQNQSASSDIPREIDPTVELRLSKIINGDSGTVGRKAGIRNRTNEENASIALMGMLLGGRATEDMTGVGGPQQHVLKEGYTGPVPHGQKKAPKDELLDEIYGQAREVTNRTFTKLIKSLDLIDDPNHRLQDIKDPAKLVGVAKSLSGIIKDVTPKDSNTNEGGVHFHIYRPEQNTEADYETIEVGKDGSVTVSA
jgi:hypothetical protein